MERAKRWFGRLLLGLFALLVIQTAVIAAQDVPPVSPPLVDWKEYAAIAINAILVPVVVKLLRPAWASPSVPSIVKTLIPLVAGSLLMMAQTAASTFLGFPIDLSTIGAILTGAGGGLASTVAYKFGKTAAGG